MTTIVRAKGAAHFLSLIPPMLGFTPRESLVLIPFERGRSLGGMRFDLPGPDEPSDAIDRIAATVIGMVCRIAQADAFAVVVYTDAAYGDIGEPPQAALAAALLAKADACGLTLTDALCVAVDAWGSFIDPDCPDDGRPLDDLPMPDDFGDGPLARDQTAGAELPASDPQHAELVAHALESITQAIRLVTDQTSEPDERIDPTALSALCALNDLPLLFETAIAWDPASVDPFDAASMIYCLNRPSVRDVALAQWCDDFAAGDAALDAQLRWEEGDAYPDELACRMWGEGARPHRDRLSAALTLARALAAVAPSAARPGPLAVCAWLSWALGGSTHAELYCRQALELEPEHGLAEIVLTFVVNSHLPEWAFERPTRAELAPTT